MARYFGIQSGIATHDASIAGFDDDGNLLFYSESERFNRVKNANRVYIRDVLEHEGLWPITSSDYVFTSRIGGCLSHIMETEFHKDKSHSESNGVVFKDMSELALNITNARYCFIPHHYGHIAASWMFRDNEEESLGIAIDGGGDTIQAKTTSYVLAVVSPDKFEVQPQDCDWDRIGSHRLTTGIQLQNTKSIAQAGKLMGLSGYFPPERIPLYDWFKRPEEERKFYSRLMSNYSTNGMTEQVMIDFSSVYLSYIRDVRNQVATWLGVYPQRNVLVGGGCFLALELNTFISEQGRNLVFAPPANDGGLGLGLAAVGYFAMKGKWPKPLTTPFLQWAMSEDRTGGYLAPKEAADLLMKEKVLAVVTGKGEAGPRALGNRSFLAIPTKAMAEKVSIQIKRREFYRPVAPIVTDRDFDRLFIGPKGRYMQYKDHCTDKAKELTPGIVHGDNSARAQVLYPNDNPWLYELLVEIGKLTGAECLINTSLNGPGAPICNSVADVKREALKHPDIRLVYF